MARGHSVVAKSVGLVVAVLAAGWVPGRCVVVAGEDPALSEEHEPPDWMAGKDLRPTYAGGVALVYEHRCVSCHRTGEVAPMSFMSYDEIRKWETGATNTPLESLLQTRAMPPWPADPRVGEFSNSLFLSKPELDLLLAWIQGGFPRGEGSYAPRERIEGWNIGKPDHLFDLPEHRVKPDGKSEVREFEVPTDFREDRWIVAAEARPGNAAMVVSIDGGPLGSYRIGNTFVEHRPGTGRLLKAGETIRVRVTYAKTRRAGVKDASRLAVVFAKDAVPQKDLHEDLMPVADFTIPAGSARFEVRTQFEFPREGQIHSLMPVMNLRGKDVSYRATFPDGSQRALLSIPQWDPMWKYRYQLRNPLDVPAGTVVEAIAHFDNSEANIRNPNPLVDVRSGPDGEVFESWIGYTFEPR